jgi:hypothetical protein
MAAQKPFKLSGATPTGGTARDVIGRFARADACPANPLSERKPATNDQQVMSGWAPGIGQGSAQMTGQNNPYPAIQSAKSVFRGS